MTDVNETATSSDVELDQELSVNCWACSAPLKVAELFCAGCGKPQPLPAAVDYFQVFGLQRRFQLDVAGLERDFYRLNRRLHPDVYAGASRQEQEWSLANSSLVNDAYRTLKEPVKRTEYLLAIEGISTGGDGPRKEDRVPADLLEEVFELNMQLDEMRISRQMGESDPQLQKDLMAAKENFDGQFKDTDAALQKLWKQWDAGVDSGNAVEMQAAKQGLATLLDRRRYIRNLVDSVNDALGV